MQLIMDGLLVAGALFAGAWCWVLSRRVRALKDLDSGLGGAITRMTLQIEQARRALDEAKAASRDARQDLKDLVNRADAAAGQLRILLAASRDREAEASRPPPVAAVRSPAAMPGRSPAAIAGRALAADAPRPRRAQQPAGVAAASPDAAPEPGAGADPEGEPQAAPSDNRPDIPKPRRLPTLPTLPTLRPRPGPPAADEPARSEAEILAALSALAAGERS